MPDSQNPRLTPGRLLYLGVHRPLEVVRKALADGGPFAQRETERQRMQMVAAAAGVSLPKPDLAKIALSVHFLTGARFWYQTVFCAASLAHHGGQRLACHIHDDGSLDADHAADIRRALGPDTVIHLHDEARKQLDALLPKSRFPILRERHQHYPNIRKLIDPHLGSVGWKCVLDSDMLFFRKPGFLAEWLSKPTAPCHMVDCETSYGYPTQLLSDLCSALVAERVNVGICGLNSGSIDWVELESWCQRLHGDHGTSYFLEQALVAMLVARESAAVAPADDYVCLPSRREVAAPTAAMHHYVAGSKRWYFRNGWRNCGVVPARQ